MDLDPAAVEAAALAISGYNAAQWQRWKDTTHGQRYRLDAEIALETAYPIIAASVARATADAIADKIEAIHHEGMPARNHAMKLAAKVARSHGSQAQVVASARGRETVQAEASPVVAAAHLQPDGDSPTET
jgi:hypothetical protein